MITHYVYKYSNIRCFDFYCMINRPSCRPIFVTNKPYFREIGIVDFCAWYLISIRSTCLSIGHGITCTHTINFTCNILTDRIQHISFHLHHLPVYCNMLSTGCQPELPQERGLRQGNRHDEKKIVDVLLPIAKIPH